MGDDVAPDRVNAVSGDHFYIGDDNNMMPQPTQQFFIGDKDPVVETGQPRTPENSPEISGAENFSCIAASESPAHEARKEAARRLGTPDADSTSSVLMESSVARRIRIAGLVNSSCPVAPEDERG